MLKNISRPRLIAAWFAVIVVLFALDHRLGRPALGQRRRILAASVPRPAHGGTAPVAGANADGGRVAVRREPP